LLPIPPLGDAVSFGYRQPVLCPMGTSTPLLVRTFRRTRDGLRAVPLLSFPVAKLFPYSFYNSNSDQQQGRETI